MPQRGITRHLCASFLAAVFGLATWIPTSHANAPSPSNDNFQDAKAFPANPDNTNLVGATLEAGEPNDECGHVENTVWYKFLPWYDGSFVADTYAAFKPRVALYRGDSPSNLVPLACGARYVNFSGTTEDIFYLQVGVLEGDPGPMEFRIVYGYKPAHDYFENAKSLQPSMSETLSINATTLEVGEPNATCFNVSNTVWYSYSPTDASHPVVIRAAERNFGVGITIFTGSTFDDLTLVACQGNQLSFVAAPGEVYYIQVGKASSAGEYFEYMSIRFSYGAAIGADIAALELGPPRQPDKPSTYAIAYVWPVGQVDHRYLVDPDSGTVSLYQCDSAPLAVVVCSYLGHYEDSVFGLVAIVVFPVHLISYFDGSLTNSSLGSVSCGEVFLVTLNCLTLVTDSESLAFRLGGSILVNIYYVDADISRSNIGEASLRACHFMIFVPTVCVQVPPDEDASFSNVPQELPTRSDGKNLGVRNCELESLCSPETAVPSEERGDLDLGSPASDNAATGTLGQFKHDWDSPDESQLSQLFSF